jgi:hypothetical protein
MKHKQLKRSSYNHLIGAVKAQKIDLQALLRVSAHGDGLYLFIPRDIVDVYGIVSGDRVKVKLLNLYRLEKEAELDKEEERIETVLVKRKSK